MKKLPHEAVWLAIFFSEIYTLFLQNGFSVAFAQLELS
jgi:hypothetical protein